MKSLELWIAIAMIVVASSIGDVLLSSAMKRIGDLDELRLRRGILAVIAAIFSEKQFLLAIACMSVGFFSLLTALSWGDASLVGPASASLTFMLSAVLAKVFLKERVDHRRWMSALLVCVGVVLLTM
ncbi:MAG TPA: EamA family transporter [Candidatus Angelobacter sp.]|jgi:drug/metabolite transporter (DMT)-like permease|nr:EamA family transporter [Candidatus Angelobacter sp.]